MISARIGASLFSVAIAALGAVASSAGAVELEIADAFKQRLQAPFTGDFDEIVDRGVLRVLVPFSRTNFFLDKGVQRGITVDLMNEFGKFLTAKYGSRVRDGRIVMIPTSRDQLLPALVDGRGDIAAGSLTVTPGREEIVAFSDPMLTGVKEIVVTAKGHDPISSAEGLSGKQVYVRPSSSYRQSLDSLNERLAAAGKPPVEIVDADERLADEDLLEMVNANAIEAVVVDDYTALFWNEVFDNLMLHTDAAVREDGEIAYAIRKDNPKLKAELDAFVKTVKKGTLLGNIILKRYLKETDYLADLSDPAVAQKTEELKEIFRKYGEQFGVDWVLVAAQSFQESKFDQALRSKAGAVGLMQIKPATAADENIGIQDVATSADNNVHAGVKYLRFLADGYFQDLQPDVFNQILFAFAAYNAGPSRFDRIREEAKSRGLDPNKWFDNVEWVVRDKVGREPVDYVGKIYKYYIVFLSERARNQAASAAPTGTSSGD